MTPSGREGVGFVTAVATQLPNYYDYINIVETVKIGINKILGDG